MSFDNINIKSGNDGINTNEDGISVTTVNGGNLNRPYILSKIENIVAIKEARDTFRKAVDTKDFLIIGRGCDYDQYDSFWIFGLLTDKLNTVIKTCDPGSIIEIKDDLTYPDKQ